MVAYCHGVCGDALSGTSNSFIRLCYLTNRERQAITSGMYY